MNTRAQAENIEGREKKYETIMLQKNPFTLHALAKALGESHPEEGRGGASCQGPVGDLRLRGEILRALWRRGGQREIKQLILLSSWSSRVGTMQRLPASATTMNRRCGSSVCLETSEG